MPIYEYQCEACGKVFEAQQKMSDPPLKKHPECKSKKKPSVKKLISATSFQLKGEGWYVTDYKKKPADKKPDEKPAEEKTETKADEKKTETPAAEKPAPEKEPKKKKKGKDAA